VWISEVMLQQTQVATVIGYFERFVARFPNVDTLARAELDEVLHLWSGLGYYARARNLHAAAKQLVAQHAAELPADLGALMALPGIGRSTAGAILSAGFGIRAPILDGNAKRVLARQFAVAGYPGENRVANELWRHAETNTPAERVADYTQAIMDLGATLCVRGNPRCEDCPVRSDCCAYRRDSVGSHPAPRPRKALPVRRVRMFLVTDGEHRCLLERRPPTGVWGGLWSPPERPCDYDIDALLGEFGLAQASVVNCESLPGFRHTFTHFHMDIEPLRVELAASASVIAEIDRWLWYPESDGRVLGLSAAAVRLLALLNDASITS
jgi:A/G-specific adenine glycosylase